MHLYVQPSLKSDTWHEASVACSHSVQIGFLNGAIYEAQHGDACESECLQASDLNIAFDPTCQRLINQACQSNDNTSALHG